MLVVSFFGLQATLASAQISAGAMIGTISDTSGALMPGVEVTATNEGTNQVRRVITNETGSYRIDPLQVGVYTISAELTGFRKEVRTNIKIDVDARVRIDFRMEVGAVSEVVEVLGTAPVVQTDSSQVGQVIEQRKIEDLPLPGRNFSALAYITPGTFAPRPGSHLSNRGGFVALGMDERHNQYLLDGVNNNGSVTMEIALRINIDTVGEFKIQTQNYPAQYGRYAGAQVDAITKSGTNEFHGSLFGFTRNDNLDARNFFNPTSKNPEFKRHQYGGVLGGPIIEDKLFFFAGYQGQREINIRTSNPTIPVPDFWDGNLSRLNKTIRDPLTGQPFPNSQIPRNRIHPVSLRIRPLYGAATYISNDLVRNATGYIRQYDNFHQPNVKINYNLSQFHQIIGAYNLYDDTFLDWTAQKIEIPGFLNCCKIRAQLLALQDVIAFSPTVINEFRAGWNRQFRPRQPEQTARDYARELGIVGTGGDFDPVLWRYPLIQITGYDTLGGGQNDWRAAEGNWSVTDTLSIQKGNHALKVGADVYLQYITRFRATPGTEGQFTFTGSTTGDAFADFLLGYPDSTARGIPAPGVPITHYPHQWSTNWFIQDDWRKSSNLTFNMGLRYELTLPKSEKFGQLSSFDPDLGGGKGGIRLLTKSKERYQSGPDFFKALYPDLVFGYSDQHYKTDWNSLAPRFGFAWTPGGRTTTVVRGGYGIFFQVYDLNTGRNQTPFFMNQRFTQREHGPTWDNPFPGSSPTFPYGEPGKVPVGAIVIASIQNNLRNDYYSHWNLNIQRELPGGVALDVAYVGKKGSKLPGPRDINQPLTAFGPKPYPLFAPIIYDETRGNRIYHGLQSRIEKRSTNGATVLLAYAWGKLIDDGSRRAGGTPQNSYDLRSERGRGQEDMRHRFSGSFVYELPFGRNLTGIAGIFASGWEISGIARANTGVPLTPGLSGDLSGRGTRTDRPNLVGKPSRGKNADPKTGWWDRSAFQLPERGSFGNAGRGSVIGPAFVATDLSIMKRFRVSESKDVQFRWETFNAFNQVNFYPQSGASLNFDSPAFGTIGNAIDGRQMQAALKFNF